MNYKDLVKLTTYEERLRYLLLPPSLPTELVFGELRNLNQRFYMSKTWKQIRQAVIVRDRGYDLGVYGMEIPGRLIVHHIVPIIPDDIVYGTDKLLNLNNLITVSDQTHRAIHFGSEINNVEPTERFKGDTTLWKKLF